MTRFKFYRKDNYIVVVNELTQETQYGFVKEVRVDKSNLNKASYRIFNVKDFDDKNSLVIDQLLKEDGSVYDQTEFETFYTQNTGNFNGGSSTPGVESVTGVGVDNTDPENPIITSVEEAPIDGTQYGREDGAWTEVVSVSPEDINIQQLMNSSIRHGDLDSNKVNFDLFTGEAGNRTFNAAITNTDSTKAEGIYFSNDILETYGLWKDVSNNEWRSSFKIFEGRPFITRNHPFFGITNIGIGDNNILAGDYNISVAVTYSDSTSVDKTQTDLYNDYPLARPGDKVHGMSITPPKIYENTAGGWVEYIVTSVAP